LDRVIGHLDLDYFYAQVEEAQDPSIKARPVLVCVFSGRTEESGVVSTANYRARVLGVNSGMPIVLAKRKLIASDPVIIKMEHEKYEAISERIMQALSEQVDTLEQTGIDEAFFDITTSTKGDYDEARSVAESIKSSILRDENLACSIGIGRSKAVANICSDVAKPAGLVIVRPESTQAFLSKLPVSKIHGVGPKTASILGEAGVSVIGDLSSADSVYLEHRLGKRFTAFLLAVSTGSDDDPVLAGIQPAQLSRVVTLKRDTRDPDEAFQQIAGGVDYIHDKLASAAKSFRTVTAIGILTDLSTRTKSKTLETPVNDAVTLREYAQDLFRELSASVPKDFRRVGLRVSGLVNVDTQKSLSEFLQPAR
jgi:DNA polymerase IV (DinB-like DNA polymerase)